MMGARKTTVLVVDDDVDLRRSMVRVLESRDHRVIEAGNAHEARKALNEAGGDVDVVIMDLVLPGLEGREAANLLLARNPDVRIIFTSGYTSQESIRMGALPEEHEFIRKPFELDELVEAVEGLQERDR
jgi:two-component system cell cycle sensor histidine kinase/response regulator CckA